MCLAVNDYKKCELNSKSKLHRVSIGSGSNGTYNATSIPNYSSLTADNFAFVVTSALAQSYSHQQGQWVGITSYPKLSYDSSTGTVTVAGCNVEATPSCYINSKVSGTVYCFY